MELLHCLAIQMVFMWHQTSCLAEMGKWIYFSAQTHSPVSRLGFVCKYTNNIPITSARQTRRQILSVCGGKGSVTADTHPDTGKPPRKEAARGNAAKCPQQQKIQGRPRFRVQGWLWVRLRLGPQVLSYHGIPYLALHLLLLLLAGTLFKGHVGGTSQGLRCLRIAFYGRHTQKSARLTLNAWVTTSFFLQIQ